VKCSKEIRATCSCSAIFRVEARQREASRRRFWQTAPTERFQVLSTEAVPDQNQRPDEPEQLSSNTGLRVHPGAINYGKRRSVSPPGRVWNLAGLAVARLVSQICDRATLWP
jgi:hypothetical protein